MSPLHALASLALAWLLTYLVHSTLFLGGALLASTWIRRLALRWQDRLWKVALVGGLATATAQVGIGLEPLGGRIALARAEAGAHAPVVAEDPADLPSAVGEAPESAVVARRAALPRRSESSSVALPAVTLLALEGGAQPAPSMPAALEPVPAALDARAAPPARSARERVQPWIPWLGAAWGAVALLGVSAYLRAHGRLRRHLAGRVRLHGGPLRERLDTLMARGGVKGRVRLCASPFIDVPLTHGLLWREICVPVRALTDLFPHQQEALLGHELGHAIRRDPAWLGFCWLLERVLFLQPLNRVARQRLQHGAELLCDDWAVHLTGRRLSLASCLTEVAQWVVGRRLALPAPSMAAAGAPLTQRVERLLAGPPREVTRREPWWVGLGLAAVGTVAVGAPGFASARVEATRAPARDREDVVALPHAPPTTASPTEALAALEPAPAASSPLGELLVEFDQELDLAAEELRQLRREAHALGADERLADELANIEAGMRLLGARRAEIRALLPRALEVLEAAEPSAPFTTTPSLPLRNPVR